MLMYVPHFLHKPHLFCSFPLQEQFNFQAMHQLSTTALKQLEKVASILFHNFLLSVSLSQHRTPFSSIFPFFFRFSRTRTCTCFGCFSLWLTWLAACKISLPPKTRPRESLKSTKPSYPNAIPWRDFRWSSCQTGSSCQSLFYSYLQQQVIAALIWHPIVQSCDHAHHDNIDIHFSDPQLMRLGVVQWHLMKLEEAITSFNAAEAYLSLTHGMNHPTGKCFGIICMLISFVWHKSLHGWILCSIRIKDPAVMSRGSFIKWDSLVFIRVCSNQCQKLKKIHFPPSVFDLVNLRKQCEMEGQIPAEQLAQVCMVS